MIPDRRAAAAIVAVMAAVFVAAYAAAPPAPGAWGAWRSLPSQPGGPNGLEACHSYEGGFAAVLRGPFSTLVEWPLQGAAVRLGFAPSASCASPDGRVAVGGSLGGVPVIAVASPGGGVEAYGIEGAWGSIVSLDCGPRGIAFAAATYNNEVVVGYLSWEGRGWAWLVHAKTEGAWGAGAALTPWGALAAAGSLAFNATPGGAVAYRVAVPGVNVSLGGAAWGPGGEALYGSVEKWKGWGAALLLHPTGSGWEALLVNTSSSAGYIAAAYPEALGYRLYYSPRSWWDALAYASPGHPTAYGLRLVHPYPHSVEDASFTWNGTLDLALVDVSAERRAVCLFLPRLRPAIVGWPGKELVTVKPLSRPDSLHARTIQASLEPLNATAEKLSIRGADVDWEEATPGEWSLEHSGLDRARYALIAAAYAAVGAVAVYCWMIPGDLPPTRPRRG